MTAPLPNLHPTASRPRSARITDAWQHKGLLAVALLPLSWLYAGLGALRRNLYRVGLFKRYRAPVPVVVVGNVIAGGAGKTPVTMHLVQALQAQGWRPSVISRGSGRTASTNTSASPAALAVSPNSDPADVGDEPLLIAQRTGVPVFVARLRAHAAQAALLADPAIDILVCDDGLQHLALARDIEIAVFNQHGVGNGWQLPAGPLREPWPRALDFAVYSGQPAPQFQSQLQSSGASAWPQTRRLADYAIRRDGSTTPLASLRTQPVQALAAIAYPQEFFAMLGEQGLQLAQSYALPDHANLADAALLQPLGILPPLATAAAPTIEPPVLLCTEKDAHKLWQLVPHALAVPLVVAIDPAFAQQVQQRLLALGYQPRHTANPLKD